MSGDCQINNTKNSKFIWHRIIRKRILLISEEDLSVFTKQLPENDLFEQRDNNHILALQNMIFVMIADTRRFTFAELIFSECP